ncbi:hypothetical protein CRE_22986 [Caenorhabditis remanei]|uniref:Uncharacterized protein n=1 Tax=Caenorhabditis remanei TaxID=31234 RepID=E3MW82_CAERE|nr:hypothetical protein CRE_22986 [Caenorhabditis remanei]
MSDSNSSEVFDESLSSKVFDNPHLLEIIVSNLTWNCESNLNTRLINKSFNYLFLRVIKRNHRKMKIEFIGLAERRVGTAKDWIYINYRKIKKSIIPGYFNFLNKVVGVKVEEIITKYMWRATVAFYKYLHNIIYSHLIGDNRESVRRLIGLEDLCKGCVKCADMAKRCVEYGPLRFRMLRRVKNPIHYRKLHISDALIECIADYCTLKSTTKKKCLKKLDSIIRRSISCDTLVLWISETREFVINGVLIRAHFPMPREVLDVMIRKWNVKSVKLNMICRMPEFQCSEKWVDAGYFTNIKVNGPYWKTDQSNLKIHHVSVRVLESYDCARGLMQTNPKTEEEKIYENYIANLRRLFQMDKISIDFGHWRHKYSVSLEEFMKNILRVIQLEKQRKLEVNIQFFTEICSFKVGNSEELAEIPSEYSLLSDRVECIRMFVPFEIVESGPERLNMIKWVGRRFQVKDMDNHFTLNLNIYVKETELRELDNGLMEKHPNSLIGVFLQLAT